VLSEVQSEDAHGSDLMTSRAGESSCTVLIARTGIEMTEAHHDNAMHRTFVGYNFHADRTTFCCAWHSNFSDSPLRSGRHVCSIQRMTTHNPASISAGMIAPVKIQVTSFRPLDKLSVIAK
jgi:hypothetical protein